MKANYAAFLRLSANYTSLYIYLGIMTPFWGMWLRNKGLSPSEIGIIIALPYLMKVIVAPLISQAADKRGEYWRPLLISIVLGTVFTGFYFVGTSFWSLLLITFAVNLCFPAVTPLLETITVSQSVKHDLNYGRIRSFGSVSFIVATVVVGLFLKSYSIDYVLWAVCGSLLFLLTTVLCLPRGNKRVADQNNLSASPMKSLLKSNEFVWFLIVVGLLQMSHGVFYSMGSIYWKENGIDEDIIGLLWGVGVVAEVLLFVFCNNVVKKYPVFLLFAVIGFCGVIRWMILSMTMSLPILFIIQILHGVTFGASHLAAIQYMASKITPARAGTAQSLYSALPLGLGMGLSTYVGGVIYERESAGAYIAMAFLCAVALLLSIIFLYRKK